MQFNIVICGLDSVEARRWINATLVNLVDPENPESLKPLIDGGTEGSSFMLYRLGQRPNFRRPLIRLQGSISRHIPDYFIMLRVVARHAE